MFSLFLKSLPPDFFQGCCDMHCHILPGVDDGCATFDDSLKALKHMEKLGFKKIRLTPHFMETYPDNVKDTIKVKFEDFRKEMSKECGIELHLSAEHMIDGGFISHFERGFLTLDDDDLVLCETSYLSPAPDMSNLLFEIMQGGCQPVIAHPERYQYATKERYERWKDRNYMFQLNLLSLSGAYGGNVKEKALDMLHKGMYDFVGTDLHKVGGFEKLVPQIKLKTKEIDLLHALYEKNATLFR